ncbi:MULTISPECIES: PadR family transcriptional regulator [Microbacterium]|uniref:PadR family transcriptional regulator n=1 Tax=Microbacterium TaxID=33882 RepID=UPI002789D31A|nr:MULTISPECIES: PadR family transcriptional regulator [Microbacterium]MDQ1083706.1 DNA-binding PadR family transcriptional regulator [Microbacterium sp. SORGH_AS_0344]MDQ1171017.1 DNA-binding PadR family transcriptional regulator [Microbacterium proteolyticum]
MSGSFLGDAFGGRGGTNAPGWPMSNILEGLEQLRTQFEQKTGSSPRMNKGDVRSGVLSLLLEQPMHGYQIIREIEERSGGSWKPSPGSVYPTLQLLTDEGLVQAEESNGRKTYSLTAEGRAAAGDETTERTAPWESATTRDSGRMTVLPKAGVELAQAAAQVARTGNKEQVQQAVEILDEARRKLYSILAQG